MKVLQITPNIGSGSVGRIVEDLYFGIKNNGDECKIAYGRESYTKVPKEDIWKIGNKFEVYIHAIYSRIFDRISLDFASSFGTKQLIKQIEDYKPDIIQLHGNYSYYINVRILFNYLAKANIKVVSTFHSCWDFTGHCCYFTFAQCNKWQTGCNQCPEKKAFPSSFVFDNSKKNFNEKKHLFTSVKNKIIVTPSYWLKDLVGKSFLSKYPVRVINNGIDIESFKINDVDISKYGISKEKPIILGVASFWGLRKGLQDFIELAEFTKDDIQIVVVGVNKKNAKTLPKNIITINRTESKQELAALYSAATVLFNPTYEDNYPTVNLESIACGTPVITYQTGGSPEIIQKYNGGVVIEKKDYKNLLKLVNDYYGKKISLSEKRLHDMSNARMVNDYLSLYSEILNGGDIKC